MKYFKLRFMSTSGILDNYYTTSKDEKTKLNLDYNRECIIPENKIGEYVDKYNIFSIEYVGQIPAKE